MNKVCRNYGFIYDDCMQSIKCPHLSQYQYIDLHKLKR
jgi:hypothetical protein